MECKGDQDEHCCWINGEVCEFLIEDDSDTGRRWVCSLRAELGSWTKVHTDVRYLERVKPKLEAVDLDFDCGDWPRPGEKCATCGVIGNG